MTDADDAGLVERLRQMKTEVCDCRWHSYPFEEDIADIHRAADLLSTQHREIEELRRELEKAIKALREIRAKDEAKSALAFAAKHGGRDG